MRDPRDTHDIPQDTINAALSRAVARHADRIFLDFSGETYSFGDVDRLTTQLAHGFAEVGVAAGEPVASILDNSIDAVLVWFALNKIGAIYAPVNTAFKGEYLRAQIQDCGAKVVVAETDYAERVVAIKDNLPAAKHLFVRNGKERVATGGLKTDTLDALRSKRTDAIPDAATPDQTCMLVYTSGTTGASKGCMTPHNVPCNMGWRNVHNRGTTADDVLWSALPLFHLNAIGSTVATALIAGCRAAIAPRFSVTNFWPDVRRAGANNVSLLGSMASLIADAPDNEDSRACYGQLQAVNAAPFPPAVVEKWRARFGIAVAGSSGYGMTEAPTISTLGAGESMGPPSASGRPGIDHEVLIADDQDNPVPVNTPGEVICRPKRPNIMFSGYWNKPAETLKAFRNLWFHTGDLGRIDEQGYFYFVDRKKDYIRRRGENISTHEMEGVFRKHPAIQDIAVHAVRSPLGEDDVKITVEILPGQTITEEALCRWAIDQLPYFAVPRYVEFRETLPRNATGKVLKEELRQQGKTATTWDREEAGLTFTRR